MNDFPNSSRLVTSSVFPLSRDVISILLHIHLEVINTELFLWWEDERGFAHKPYIHFSIRLFPTKHNTVINLQHV